MKYKIALGIDMGTVENREYRWAKIADSLSRHSVAVTKGGRYFVGGQFADHRRQETSLVCRSMLTIDMDKLPEGVDIVDLENDLVFSVPYAFVAYSTFSHTPERPRIRLIVPLSRDVTPAEYREVSRDFVSTLSDVMQSAIDKCSFVPNQFMYMPICADLSTAWSYTQEGEPYAVPDQVLGDYAKAAVKKAKPAATAPLLSLEADADADADAGEAVEPVAVEVEADIDDLADAVANEPLDLSDDEVDAYLRVYRADGLEYDQWLMVGAALNHQYRRGETGYQRWLAWSKLSSKHDETHMRVKWRSFGKGTTYSLVTFKSVIFLAKEMGDVALREDRAAVREAGVVSLPAKAMVELEAFEALAEAASEVDSVEAYDAFKARLQRISLHILPVDKRSMLAQEIYDSWGKGKGLTKSDIKAAIQPPKAGKSAIALDEAVKRDIPDWLDGWVYITVPGHFYNMHTHYAAKREAFDLTYGGEPDVLEADLPASKLAINHYRIDTLVDMMFWPGAGLTFEHEGKRMLNTYRQSGHGPCIEMDADGQSVVDLFLGHVKFLLDDEAEQRLLVDFMAWVVQNPGQKVNWSLVIQGAQGVGKSYFGHVMMLVLGDMARNVEPSSFANRFTGWAYGATLIIIEEIRVTGDNRYEIIDRLKPFISNATIQIEEKGRDHRTVPNFTSYLMFTNHKDALPLGAGDRRYAPIFSRVQSEAMLFDELGGQGAAGEYFTKLFSETDRRPDALSRFLRDWKISEDFNAKGRAPHTKARDLMMDLAVSPERRAVEDAIAKHQCAVVNDMIVDVTWLNKLCDLEGGEGESLPKTRTLSAVMLDMGYTQVKGGRVWISDAKRFHYVWHKGTEQETIEAVQAYHDGN